jgi:hypothetical protein
VWNGTFGLVEFRLVEFRLVELGEDLRERQADRGSGDGECFALGCMIASSVSDKGISARWVKYPDILDTKLQIIVSFARIPRRVSSFDKTSMQTSGGVRTIGSFE